MGRLGYTDIQGRIGGPGHVLEIDETKVGKRNYNVGRMVERNWILSMIEVGTGETLCNYRIEICPENKRDGNTLIPLIEKHVAPGTTIITDLWRRDVRRNDMFRLVGK